MNDEQTMRAASQRMASMNPEAMKQQAAALRAADPNAIRASNPHMANFSDAQIQEAADQMEQMANDPRLMQQAASELKNMSPADLEAAKRQMLGGGKESVLQMGAHPADGSAGGFPVGCRVVCQGLVGAAQYNGAAGEVRGALNEKGRQNVWVATADKCMLLKPDNLAPEPRELESLTAAELKAVLVAKGSPGGASEEDVAALRELVECEVMPDDDLSLLIAQAKYAKPVAAPPPPTMSESEMKQSAAAMKAMNPDTMRKNAAALRAMDPNEVRRRNVQMANFTDAQIQEAANQMDAMANDPSMIQQAAAEMERMSPQQLEEMKRQMVGGASGSILNSGGAGGGASSRASDADLLNRGASAMAQMDPARLRQQAAALRSMNPDQVRRTSPQMANMTDAQIQQAADQMEQMANNPAMMNAAREQMKNMTPQQMEMMRQQMGGGGRAPTQQQAAGGSSSSSGASGGGAAPAMPGDANAMLNMDPAQLKQMLTTLKSNPALVKQMMASIPGSMAMSEDAFLKQMEALEAMDEKQLGAFLGYANKAKWAMDKAKDVWAVLDKVCLGHAKYVVTGAGLLGTYLAVSWARSYFGGGSGSAAADSYASSFGAVEDGTMEAAAGLSAGSPNTEVEVDEFGNTAP